MKSEMERHQKEKFPKLMISDEGEGIVVLISGLTGNDKNPNYVIHPRACGTIVHITETFKIRHEKCAYEIGDYAESWLLNNFRDFNGSIILEN
jgi:hypothetical protein